MIIYLTGQILGIAKTQGTSTIKEARLYFVSDAKK